MKTQIHRSGERGVGEHGWLSTRYSFSFADWYEPTRMGFGALRVINDDTIAPQSGFGAHTHKDMEIITIVTGGCVTHQDSMGTQGAVCAGEVQVMSAGTGVVHAETNQSLDTPLTLFQIWIQPNARGVAPRYAQSAFDAQEGRTLLVSPMGHHEGLHIHQDAYITRLVGRSESSESYVPHTAGNGVYVFVVDGSVRVGDVVLGARDALGVEDSSGFQIHMDAPSILLVIEVPM